MCPSLLGDARLYELLLQMDLDLAGKARELGCACGGALHQARFERKPRGATVRLPEGYGQRESFCCSRDGCRKRTTPPSVRYLGRKVYLGAVVVVITAMKHRRVAELMRLSGASRETIARWRRWWAEAFAATAFWEQARGRFATPVSASALPDSLIARFETGEEEGERGRLIRVLDFIKPVTSRVAGKERGK